MMENYVELSFPVPWGHIAAKAYGDPCSKPVLVIHGRQDNAGSFDRLIAILPNSFYYVSIDLPGHGYSTRMPKGIPLDIMSYLNAVRRVIIQLKWEEFYFLGHSLGGQLGTLYAATYPESVTKLITIDAYPLFLVSKENYTSYNRTRIEDTITLEEKLKGKSPPTYTEKEALERLITHRPTPLTIQSAERFLPRALRRNNAGFYYSTDQRLKFHLTTPLDPETYYFLLSQIRCPYLCFISEETPKIASSFPLKFHLENTIKALQTNSGLQLVWYNGEHDIHSNQPEKLSELITTFLIHKKCNL